MLGINDLLWRQPGLSRRSWYTERISAKGLVFVIAAFLFGRQWTPLVKPALALEFFGNEAPHVEKRAGRCVGLKVSSVAGRLPRTLQPAH